MGGKYIKLIVVQTTNLLEPIYLSKTGFDCHLNNLHLQLHESSNRIWCWLVFFSLFIYATSTSTT